MTVLIGFGAMARAVDHPAEASFTIAPAWTAGDVFCYAVTKTQRRESGTNSDNITKVTYVMDLRVIKVGPGEEILEAGFRDFKLINPPDPTGESAKLAAISLSIPLIYSVTPEGQPKRLQNWDSVKDGVVKVYAKLLESKPAATRDRMQKEFTQSLNDPAQEKMYQAAMLGEVQMFHGLFGGTFTNVPRSEKTSVHSPVGNVELPATVTAAIVARDGPWVTVQAATECGDDAGAIMAKALRDLDTAAGRKAEIPQKITVKSKVVYTATFRSAADFPTTSQYSKVSQVDDLKDSLELVFKRVETTTRP